MITMSVWVVVGLAFLLGVVLGAFVVDLYHRSKHYLLVETIHCLADQNVELFKELKEAKSSWTEEGEEWKGA